MRNEKQKVALSSIFGALIITTLKLVVGLMTNSLGLLSEAAHSGLDLIAAGMTYFAVTISGKAPDREHQFGHGKVENLSALFETLLLIATCGWIIYEALHRLAHGGVEIEPSVWGFVVIIISIVVDITRSRALSKAARKYNSQALEADALHFSSDVWSSLVVLMGLVLLSFGITWMDAVAALIVAVLVLSVSFRMGTKTVNVLIDGSMPIADERWLNEYLSGLKEPVMGYHGLRTRMAGSGVFIEVHLVFKPELTIEETHNIGDTIIENIQKRYPDANVTTHFDYYKDE